MAQPVVGCGLGANLLAHQPDLEKGADCCDPPDARRTWRQWARRNDCCFAKKNCAGAILCSPYTAVKWFVVGIFTIPLFWTHFGMGLSRFFFGGAFHMVCRVLCHNKSSTGLTVCYYVVAGVPLCEKQGRYGRPARPKRLIGRGWPHPGGAAPAIF